MNGRVLALPLAAVALVAAVLGLQLAHGGGDFAPLRPADPCVARTVTAQASGIEGLVERLVLYGVDGAACRLGLSREALTLQLAETGRRTDAEVRAVRAGLEQAVVRMKEEGSLPKASTLVDEVLDEVQLNRFVEAAIRALPDGAIDGVVKTDDVLDRTIKDLDIRALLADLDDRAGLEDRLRAALLPALKDSVIDRLTHLL